MFLKFMAAFTGLLMFGLLSQVAYAHGMSEADKQAIVDGGNLLYMWIGATHMLSGYDHLAFVFGIIFFLNYYKKMWLSNATIRESFLSLEEQGA